MVAVVDRQDRGAQVVDERVAGGGYVERLI
jgi:hypothetical protein